MKEMRGKRVNRPVRSVRICGLETATRSLDDPSERLDFMVHVVDLLDANVINIADDGLHRTNGKTHQGIDVILCLFVCV